MAEPLGDILIRCLNEIDEVGGSERHLLRETIGADAYNALISKAKGENLLHRWLNASPKTKPVATKALALHIARIADRADLVGRIEHEIAEAFEIEKPSKARAPCAAVNQKRKRSGDPKRLLGDLARNPDASRYIRARLNSRH